MQRRPWEEAVNAQLGLRRFWASQAGHTFARGFAKDMDDKGRPGGLIAAAMPYAEGQNLAIAPAYFVSDEMVDVIVTAARSFDTEPLDVTDLPSPNGFVFLEEPWEMIDIYGKRCDVSALSWQPMKYADPDEVDGKLQISRHAMGELRSAHIDGVILTFYNNVDHEDDYNHEYREYHHIICPWTPLSMLHTGPVPFDHDWSKEGEHAETQVKRVQTFWRLCQQQIVDTSPIPLSRARRRDFERKGERVPQVRVMRLRRVHRSGTHISLDPSLEAESVPREWSHRWLVNGHWRQQYYPSIDKHRQIWIAPYVKGPDDKPLIVDQRVYELVR